MFVIPRPLLLDYRSRLLQQNIPPRQRANYHKWLRYYFDFCVKHGEAVDTPDSFKKFELKLTETHQTEENRQLARAAIAIYYDSKGVLPASTPLPEPQGDSLPKVLTRQSWQSVYENLEGCIKVRHYSKKTW